MENPVQFVQWLRSVAPYIHAFRGKTFVVAFPGELVLQTFVEGSPESGFVYVFDGAIRGRVRVDVQAEPRMLAVPVRLLLMRWFLSVRVERYTRTDCFGLLF